ncbi:RNA chaperone ProQ [Gayadomonas joobiniege]|uniref:RNA chaperone ProQ n=1 Tax=Gayadomonas joobiniege TaxID=1234606 RepID=UPI00037B453C|nr:RNA chaperone ProQ [Gayadomonas joobiniege]
MQDSTQNTTDNTVESNAHMDTNTERSASAEPEKLTKNEDIIAYLAKEYPNCFSLKGPAKPLKIGIFKDMVARLDDQAPVSRTGLRAALRRYTSSWRYLQSIKTDAIRVDLEGNEAGKIEKEHADYAAEQLKQSKQKFAERRKQKTQTDKKSGRAKVAGRVKTSNPANPSANKTKPQAKKRPPIEGNLSPGMQAYIRLGQSPVKCTIREVNGDDVVVETPTGMTVKTERKNLS